MLLKIQNQKITEMKNKTNKLWLAISLLFILVGILAYTDYKDDQLQDCINQNVTFGEYEEVLNYCNNLD